MNRLELLEALGAVAERLRLQGATARVYIVGGAAMALAYDGDRVTRDIDALILEGRGPLTEAVRAVAHKRGLPDSWLNEQASSYLPADDDRRSTVVFDHPTLRVVAAAPERVLAMKCVPRVVQTSPISNCSSASLVSPRPMKCSMLWSLSTPMRRCRSVVG